MAAAKKSSRENVRRAKSFNRIFCILVAAMVTLALLGHFKTDLYLTDRYSWYIFMGNKYNDLGHIPNGETKALEYAEKAIVIDPERLESHALKVESYRRQGLFEEAEEELFALKGSNGLIYYNQMGYIKLEQGRINESMQNFAEAIESYPSYPGGYIGMSLIYLKVGDTENAIKYLNMGKSRLENPDDSRKQIFNGRVHAVLALIYLEQGNIQKAEEEIKNAGKYDKDAVNYASQLIAG